MLVIAVVSIRLRQQPSDWRTFVMVFRHSVVHSSPESIVSRQAIPIWLDLRARALCTLLSIHLVPIEFVPQFLKKSSCCTRWATPNIKVNYRLATSRFTEHWRIWSQGLTTVRWVILNAADVTARLSRANGVFGKLVYAFKDGLWIAHCHANTQGKENDSKRLHLCSLAPAGEIRMGTLHNSTGFADSFCFIYEEIKVLCYYQLDRSEKNLPRMDWMLQYCNTVTDYEGIWYIFCL